MLWEEKHGFTSAHVVQANIIFFTSSRKKGIFLDMIHETFYLYQNGIWLRVNQITYLISMEAEIDYSSDIQSPEMWRPFTDSQNLYMFHLEESGNDFTLLLTDLNSIWESNFSNLHLVKGFQESNPLIGATDEQIKTDFLEIVQDLQNVDISVKQNESVIELVFAKNCADVVDSIKNQKIVYKFKLTKQEQDEFRKKITVPSIQTVYFLEKQQKMLLNLILRKDRELEEFRMEKGDISRGDLRTEKFDVNLLSNDKEDLLLNVFTAEKSKDFWQKFTEKNGEVQSTSLHVELEPWNAKPKKRVIHSGKKVVKKGSGVVFKK